MLSGLSRFVSITALRDLRSPGFETGLFYAGIAVTAVAVVLATRIGLSGSKDARQPPWLIGVCR